MKKFKYAVLISIVFIYIFSCERYEYLSEGDWNDLFGRGGSGGGGSPVYDAVYVVSAAVPAGNDGLTPLTPINDIQKAIDRAAEVKRNKIYVSEGDYTLTTLSLASGISLYGGYSSDFKDVDILNNPVNLYLNTIYADAVTGAVLDGFNVNYSSNSGISCSRQAEITLMNNVIICEKAVIGTNIAVQITGGKVNLFNNVIKPSSGQACNALYISDADGVCYVTLRNNTIDSGTGVTRICIFIDQKDNTVSVDLQNNIFSATSSSSYAVNGTGSYVLNRACNVYLQMENGVFSDKDDIVFNGTTETPGNLFVDYAGDDFHLKTQSELLSFFGDQANAILTEGIDGYAGGWGFNCDRDRRIRTAGWTRGAYEKDN